MASLAEVKANFFYSLARNFGEAYLEKKLPPLNPEGPLEDEGPDRFQRAFRRAYLAYTQAQTPSDKAAALTEVAQQQINTNHLRLARNSIGELKELAETLSEPRRSYFLAKALTQEAWVCDYETGFMQAREKLFEAQIRLRTIPIETWGQNEQDLHSTTVHFLGRSALGLACQRINRQRNLTDAIVYFEQDLNRFEGMRREGNPQSANEGFQHAWLGMCFLTQGELVRAETEIALTGSYFRENLEQDPKSGIMAHYHLLKGGLLLKRDRVEAAREQFHQSVRIRRDVEGYPMGEAFALLGIAKTYSAQRRFAQAKDFLVQAVNTQPAVLLYAVNGRFGG